MPTIGSAGGSVRQQAAVNASVPKGSSVTITHGGAPKAATSGKSSTSSKAAAKVAGKGATQAAAAPRNLATFNPLGGSYNTSQLNTIANNMTTQSLKASLAPLVSQAGQIQNSEGTVAGRYGQYTQQGDQILQGLQANASSGALTADNQAAQAAQNTANAIDQTGAAAKALNGGYMDPQVAAALQNQSTYGATVGGSNAALASSLGSNENDFMANLRGAAALQGNEGQANIAAAYAKQLATNRASQNSLELKAPATAAQLANTLGQDQFNDQILGKEYNLKALTATSDAQAKKVSGQVAQENARTAAQRAATAQFAATSAANYRVADLGVTAQNDYAKQRQAAATSALASGKLTAQEKQWATADRLAWAKVNSAANPTQKAQDADIAQITSISNEYKNALTPAAHVPNATTGKVVVPTPAQVGSVLAQKYSKSGAMVQAGIELGQNGFISPATQQALVAQGVTLSTLPPAWLRAPVPVTLPAPSLAPVGANVANPPG